MSEEFYEPKTLVQRLRGIYSVGDAGEFENRDFSKTGFIPAISFEAAKRIEQLEASIRQRKNDCYDAPGGISQADRRLFSVLEEPQEEDN